MRFNLVHVAKVFLASAVLVKSLPAPTKSSPKEFTIEVPVWNLTLSATEKDSSAREMNFPPSVNSFSQRTHFCGQPLQTNATQDEISKSIVSQRKERIRVLKLELQSKGLGHTNLVLATQMKPISVAFHIIYDETDGAGNFTDQAAQYQIDVMNSDYRSSGFSFELANITRTGNATMFKQGSPGSSGEAEMKRILHQGDASTLNVYSVNFEDNLLGYSTWPWDYESNPNNDGVVFLYSTVPGGDAEDYNQGKTLVHETGHWLSLFHTFQGGCDGDGDQVDDTPPEASPTSGCPSKKDTCSGDDLQDPIHNFMDYSIDECLTEFTEGQAIRMSALASQYRGL